MYILFYRRHVARTHLLTRTHVCTYFSIFFFGFRKIKLSVSAISLIVCACECVWSSSSAHVLTFISRIWTHSTPTIQCGLVIFCAFVCKNEMKSDSNRKFTVYAQFDMWIKGKRKAAAAATAAKTTTATEEIARATIPATKPFASYNIIWIIYSSACNICRGRILKTPIFSIFFSFLV